MAPKRKRTATEASEDDAEMPPEKKREIFSAKAFRKNLQGPNSFSVLKEFVHLSHLSDQKQNVAQEYLDSGGSALELLRLSSGADSCLESQHAIIFSAMEVLIMRSLTSAPHHQPSVEEACRHLINSHLKVVHSLLSVNSKPSHKKIVLRLLTAMVSLSVGLAREVLTHVTFSPLVVEALSKQAEPHEKRSVRTCFIHFLMAFLVDGDLATIRPVMDKRGLLKSIMRGLVYDRLEVVILVLTTLRSRLLETTGVSKTSKLYLFSTQVMQSLLLLYEWKGPGAWRSPDKIKRKQNTPVGETLKEDREAVAESVHQLLLILCSSHKYGVAFHDHSLGTSRTHHNTLLHSVLQNMQQPWEHPRSAELVVQTLAACPDLVRSVLATVEPFLEPRASQRWLQATAFVQQVVKALNPEVYLRPCVSDLSHHQLLSVVQALTVPASVLRPIGADALLHEHPMVRHEAAVLLSTLLTRLCDVMTALETWSIPILRQLKQGMVAYLVKQHLPDGDMVCQAWKRALKTDDIPEPSNDTPNVPDTSVRLAVLLDLLLLYQRCCPHLLEAATDLQSLLTDVRNLPDAQVQVKTYQLLLASDSSVLTPDKELFPEAVELLLGATCHSSPNVSRSARIAVTSLLRGTGLFEGIHGELPVWLHCFQNSLAGHQQTVGRFLARVVARVVCSPQIYLEMAAATDSDVEGNQHESTVAMDHLFEELMEPGDHWKEGGPILPTPSVELSPLLPGALEVAAGDRDPAVVHFVSCVVVHLLHAQTSPATLLRLVGRWPELLPEPVERYLKGWHPQGSPAPLRKPFGSRSPESRLSRALLQPHDNSVSIRKALAFDDDPEEKVEWDPHHLVLLVRLSVFYLAQLSSRGQLSEEACARAKEALICLLSAIQRQTSSAESHSGLTVECFKSVLSHPLLIGRFSPLCKKKHLTERLVTELLLEFLKLSKESLGDRTVVDGLAIPYKQRLLSCAARGARRVRRGSMLLLSTAQHLHLNQEEIAHILGLVVTMPGDALVTAEGLSPWGTLLAHLLQRARAVPLETMTAIVNQMIELGCRPGLALLELALHNYLQRCPRNLPNVLPALFDALLSWTQSRESTTQLGVLLLDCNGSLVQRLDAHILGSNELLTRPKAFLPLLLAALCHGENSFLLDAACVCYHSDIERAILKPHRTPNWLGPNIEAVKMLVEKALDVETCKQLCSKLSADNSVLDACQDYHLDLVTSLFSSAGLAPTQILLGQLVGALRSMPEKEARARHLCKLLRGFCIEGCSTVAEELPSLCLKFGLRSQDPVPLLEVLSKVLAVAPDVELQAGLVYQMAISHSEFLNVMLGEDTDTKRDLVQLLLVLVGRDKSVVQSAHVPVLLGAYSATLATTDQLILQLLCKYETHGASLQEFRPYLWGEAAVNHYSVRSQAGLSLWRVPQARQVLELLDMTRIERTLAHFPVQRQLQVLEECHPPHGDLYDPAFLLPLFSHLLAPESVVYPHMFSRSGALALTLAALGSHCAGIRAATGHVLSRYHFHLEAGRASKEKKLVLQFLDAVRGGVAELSGKDTVPQLACVVGLFLARASLVLSRPLHSLYAPLHTFLLARPSLRLNTVPELLALLHGDHVDFRVHRRWILEVLRDGLRTQHDTDISFRSPVFKLLLALYSSVLADQSTKVLILQVLESALQLPSTAPRLVSNHGLLPWLHHAVRQMATPDKELACTMAGVLAHLPHAPLPLLLALLPKLPSAPPPETLHPYLRAVARAQTGARPIKQEQAKALVKLARSCGDLAGDKENGKLDWAGFKCLDSELEDLESFS